MYNCGPLGFYTLTRLFRNLVCDLEMDVDERRKQCAYYDLKKSIELKIVNGRNL